ncbi:MAG: septum formation initiator family protein [Alphaproteobacteria bacterium]|nr:septum formation initiator family protein [Alphaproteobacteria bacterium]
MAASVPMVRGETRGFDLKRQLQLSAWPVLAALLTIYFGYYLIYGNRGLFAHFRLESKVETARTQLDAVVAKLLDCELRVNGLKPESLDLDLLEERARNVLNIGIPGDQIVLGDQVPGMPPGCFGSLQPARALR